MSAIIVVVSIIASFYIIWLTSKHLEEKVKEISLQYVLFVAIGIFAAIGLSLYINHTLQKFWSSISAVPLLAFVVAITAFSIASFGLAYLITKMHKNMHWLVQLFVWETAGIVGAAGFLVAFQITTNLKIQLYVMGAVVALVAIAVVVICWKRGEQNGAQDWLAVPIGYIVSLGLLAYIYWALGLDISKETIYSTLLTLGLMHLSLWVLSAILAIKIKPLQKRLSYRINYLMALSLVLFYCLTFVLQIGGYIGPQELETCRLKNQAAVRVYKLAVEKLLKINETDLQQATAAINSAIDSSAINEAVAKIEGINQQIADIKKPSIVVPAVYSAIYNGAVDYSSKAWTKSHELWQTMFKESNLAKKSERLSFDMFATGKFGMSLETSRKIISASSSADISSASGRELIQTALDVQEAWRNWNKPASEPVSISQAAEQASQSSMSTTTLTLNAGEEGAGPSIPNNTWVTFTSNEVFHIIWKLGLKADGSEKITFVQQPAGTSRRFFTYGGLVRLQGIVSETSIEINF